MIRLIVRRIGARDDDQGFAMIIVLFTMLILSTLTAVLLAEGLNALPQTRHEASYQAALGAAESGVDDFIDRLDQNYNYATSPDSNAALTGYVPVAPGSSATYHYSVDTSQINQVAGINYGAVVLTATGKVGKVSRTVRVTLRPVGFLDSLSTTDYNIVDPALTQVSGWTVAQTQSNCIFHAYDPRPSTPETPTAGTGPASKCSGLLNYWITGNELNGPMHSNDDFYLCGTPKFDAAVTSGDPNASRAPYWVDPYHGCGTDKPSFANGSIVGNQTITFPPADTAIETYAATGTSTGCLYTGPTAITLSGNTMTVDSPDTKVTNPGCVGSNLSLPADGVIYVQDMPADSSDPNYSASCGVDPSAWDGDDCHKGDVFIQGTGFSGQLTVAASNNVIITGSLTYSSFTATNPRPVLGLIANNEVEINHPVSASGSSACTSQTVSGGYCNTPGTVPFDASTSFNVPVSNPTIDAALLSLQHSFAVMNFDKGPPNGLGSVNLDGAVAGKFMDIEGEFGSGGSMLHGYGVNYTYDQRFANGGLVPPYFLNPTSTFWHRVGYAEPPS